MTSLFILAATLLAFGALMMWILALTAVEAPD